MSNKKAAYQISGKPLFCVGIYFEFMNTQRHHLPGRVKQNDGAYDA